MGGPQLKLERRSNPGVLAAKLILPWGSSRDPYQQRGSHQLLAATLTRGCGPYNNKDLADLVEGCGAGLQSEAHEDGMIISLRCMQEDADLLLPLMGWMVTKPHLDDQQLQLERSLALQALQRQKQDPFQVAYDSWRELVYGLSGYGHDPLGISDELKHIDRVKLLPLAARLPSGKSVLAIAGSWTSEQIDSMQSSDPFLSWSNLLEVTPSPKEIYPVEGESILSVAMETEQVVIILGQSTLSHGHHDDLPLRLLQCHLGVGMSSVLFQRLREEHGVAYDVGIHHPVRAEAAPFVLHASSSAERACLTLRLLYQSWHEILSTALSQDRLILARQKFRGGIAHGQQISSQRAERIASLHSLGLPEDHDQRCLEKIEELQPENLQLVAQRWLSKPRLCICGPKKQLSQLENLWLKLHSYGI